MQNQPHQQVLSFNCSDSLGAIGIQADLASFAAMGCHGLTVITSILIGDTTQINDIEAIDADVIVEQARTILEDVPVSSFKLGTFGSVENVSAIAEIVADYPDVPLIFDPFSSSIPDQSEESEDMYLAIHQLIIPQTSLLIASKVEIARMAQAWREEEDETSIDTTANDTLLADVQQLIEAGCQYVLVTGATVSATEIVNSLYNETGMIRNDSWPRIAGSYLGASSTLSAAVAALLANGLDMPEAVMEAQEFTNASLIHAQRFGMGKLIPDRYFWAREPENMEDSEGAEQTTL